jgi:CheY-like chemotaxis protein
MMKKALLVDDDEVYCWQLFEALAKRLKDCSVVMAGNGKEAEKIMESSRIDFVITDLNMPEMDGYEFVSRAKVSHPDVPIMVITGTKTPEVEERLHSLGISRCLEKPFDVRDMVPLILDELAGISVA